MAEDKMDFATEFPEGSEELNTSEPAEVNADASAQKTYPLADGTQGSRAAFIREKFLVDNMSRKEIAEQFDMPYRVVYSATVNMSNSAESPSRGRSASMSTVSLTADGECVVTKDNKVLVNGEIFDGAITDLGELTTTDRNAWIKTQVENGVSRGDIAKMLDMSYGVVYGITKDQEGTRARIEITLDDGVTKVSRAEYIRMQFAAGVSRGDIAKKLEVPYSVVWQATKTEKTEADHFAELVAGIKEFAGKTTDESLFTQICNALDTVQIKEEEAPAEAEAEQK